MKTASSVLSFSRPQLWQVLSMLALMLMEISLLSLWYQVLLPAVHLSWPVDLAALAVILFTSYGLSRMLAAPHLQPAARQGLFLAWLFLAAFTSLRLMVFAGAQIGLAGMLRQVLQFLNLGNSDPDGFIHLFIILLITWRGVSLARSPASLRGIQISFQLGLILLLFYGIGQARFHRSEATFGLYLFLFSGLVSMSTARIASLSSERGGRVPRFGSGWLAGILSAALGFVGLAILAGWFSSSKVVAWLIRVFALLFGVLATLVLSFSAPVFIVLSRAFLGFFDFFNRIAGFFASIRAPKFLDNLAAGIGEAIRKVIPFLFNYSWVFFGLTLLAVVIAIVIGLRLRDSLKRIEEEAESDQTNSDEKNLLQKWLRRILPERLTRRLRKPGQILAAAQIRRIYRQLTGLSAKLGVERPASLTPLEFLPRLNELFPGEEAGLDLITGAYQRVRYGEYPESVSEVRDVRRAWEAIRRTRGSRRGG